MTACLNGALFEQMDLRLLTVIISQQLRGNIEHSKSTNTARQYLCVPVGALKAHGGERNSRVDFPSRVIWGV